jgi:hypothetical protein
VALVVDPAVVQVAEPEEGPAEARAAAAADNPRLKLILTYAVLLNGGAVFLSYVSEIQSEHPEQEACGQTSHK